MVSPTSGLPVEGDQSVGEAQEASHDLASRVDELMGKYVDTNRFNGHVVLFKKGEEVLSQSYQCTEGIPLIDEPYRIGSATKIFTSFAIMHLVEKRELQLETTLKEIFHIQGMNEDFSNITIGQLLTHTSGLRGFGVEEEDVTPEAKSEDKDILTVQRSLKRKDEGELDRSYAYSNAGFYLLGRIIEEKSKMSYSQFLDDCIFRPLEMTSSGIDERRRSVVEDSRKTDESREGLPPFHYTINFEGAEGGKAIEKNTKLDSVRRAGGGGAMYSTSEDLSRFMTRMTEILSDKASSFPVRKETLLDMMEVQLVTEEGPRGLGLGALEEGGRMFWGHEGMIEGFSCMFYVDPSSKDGVIVMSDMGARADPSVHIPLTGQITKELAGLLGTS